MKDDPMTPESLVLQWLAEADVHGLQHPAWARSRRDCAKALRASLEIHSTAVPLGAPPPAAPSPHLPTWSLRFDAPDGGKTVIVLTDEQAENVRKVLDAAPSRSTPAPPQLIAENVDAYLHALNSGASSPEVRLYQSRIVTLACQWRNETRGSEGAVPAQQPAGGSVNTSVLGMPCGPHGIVACRFCWPSNAAVPPGAAEARKLAEAIVDDLFVNGGGERADRLVLMVDAPTQRDLGGWGKEAMVDRIEDMFADLGVAPAGPRDEKETP